MSISTLNNFEALCELASQENWCWKLGCTTCGHAMFRYSFSELASGKSPNDSTWIVKGHNTRLRYLSAQLGRWPKFYDLKQKEIVIKICVDAEIVAISKRCKFPDWMGYLGLVLRHMEQSPSFPKLSECWAGQLRKMMPSDSSIQKRLSDLSTGDGLSSGHWVLHTSDLELCEREIMRMN